MNPICFSRSGGLFKTTTREWWNDSVFQLAASIAFYTIFSLAPLILISVGVAGIFFSQQEAQQQIIKEIEGLTGTEGAKVARQVVTGMGNKSARANRGMIFQRRSRAS